MYTPKGNRCRFSNAGVVIAHLVVTVQLTTSLFVMGEPQQQQQQLSKHSVASNRETGWVPNTHLANSSIAWYPVAAAEQISGGNGNVSSSSIRASSTSSGTSTSTGASKNVFSSSGNGGSSISDKTGDNNNNNNINKAKLKPTGRAFHDNRIDGGTFDYTEYTERGDEYKAVPFTPNEPQTVTPGSAHFHTVLKPPGAIGAVAASTGSGGGGFSASSSSGLTLSNLQSYPSYSHSGYHYPAPQPYLPPPPSNLYLPPVVQHIESFEHHQQQQPSGGSSYENVTGQLPLETNTKHQLFVQPGKCSNSIEVGRVRDVEVRTVLKYGTDAQKGVCVLMLYAANELNKLAISLQAVQGTTNIIPAGTWLETNVKMYAVQAGDVQPIFTKSNFGPNSPALILTKSNIVILSFYVDRPLDFFLDISTYQSLTC